MASSGTQFAQYEVVRLLGRGGMGEVYEARDTQLGRRVALKFLPPSFANDPAHLARLQREARVLAALNHPGIAILYGYASAPRPFLAMELVSGESLATYLKRGRPILRQALDFAIQIAGALEAAHEHGIVHRDVKPANIMITPEDQVKVLDFGLARSSVPDPAGDAPTELGPPTGEGAAVGTPAYMAPEQVRGQATDARTDVFAFGCVLFEMLCGQRAFAAPTASDAMAAVLTREPDFSVLPADLPEPLLALLRRALAKKPRDRWQAMGDLRFECESIRSRPNFPAPPPKRPRTWPAVVLAAAGFAIALALWFRPGPPAAAPVRLALDLPPGQTISTSLSPVAVSPNGSMIAYASNAGIFLRRLGQQQAQLIPGSEPSDGSPAFSPDSRWLAYYSDASEKLVKVSLLTGMTVPLAAVDPPRGIDWDAPGQILLGEAAGGIVAVPSSGGHTAKLLTTPGYAASPQRLPGGGAMLYTLSPASLPFSLNNTEVVLQPLRGGAPRVLLRGAYSASYQRGRHGGVLLYVTGSELMQVPFNPASGEMGRPVPLASSIRVTSYNYPPLGDFAAAAEGPLVTVTGGAQASTVQLAIRSPHGSSAMLDWPTNGAYYDPAISPDGHEVAAELLLPSPAESIVVAPLDGSTSLRRLTFGSGLIPVWSPNGRDLAYGSTQGGITGLWVQPADGAAPARRLSVAPGSEVTAPDSWSPDGRTILFSRHRNAIGVGVWRIPAAGGQPKLIVPGAPHAGQAAFAPDGRWFAYFSDETGSDQVWVQPFPPTGAKYEVTSAGGDAPRWSRDGKHLYFIAGPGTQHPVLSVVDIHLTPAFAVSAQHALPHISAGWSNSGEHPFDLLPDGAFIAPVATAAPADTRIHVILHWFARGFNQ